MKAAIPHLLQYTVFFLFGFLVIYIVSGWLGSGYAAYQSIEQASLVYTISASANALSVIDEGYVTKELIQPYDIEIDRKIRDETETNYYIKVRPSDSISSGDLEIIMGERTCGSIQDPMIRTDGRIVTFFGAIDAEAPCYKLDSKLLKSGDQINVIIYTNKDMNMVNCPDCTGSIEYTGSIINMNKGIYTVNIIKGYQFKYIGQEDEILGSKEIEITQTVFDDDKNDDEMNEFFFLAEVTPATMQNADCIRIVKKPDELVRFETCAKILFTDEFKDYADEFDWYKTQIYPGSKGDCGPTSVSMAIGWAKTLDIQVSEVREYIGWPFEDGSTSYDHLINALHHYGVNAEKVLVSELDDIAETMNDGNIVILGQTMSEINMVEGDWKENKIGKYLDYNEGHYIILKEYQSGNPAYFVVYDPLSMPTDRYDNGDLAGKGRLYPADEIWDALDWRENVIKISK